MGPRRLRSLLEVRHFVDGLHEYVVESRGALLAALLLEGAGAAAGAGAAGGGDAGSGEFSRSHPLDSTPPAQSRRDSAAPSPQHHHHQQQQQQQQQQQRSAKITQKKSLLEREGRERVATLSGLGRCVCVSLSLSLFPSLSLCVSLSVSLVLRVRLPGPAELSLRAPPFFVSPFHPPLHPRFLTPRTSPYLPPTRCGQP